MTDLSPMGLQASLRVDGMTCAACAGRVERAVAALPGVSRAAVIPATRTLSTEYAAPTNAATIAEAIAEAIAKAGYKTHGAVALIALEQAGSPQALQTLLLSLPGITESVLSPDGKTLTLHHLAGALSPTEIASHLSRSGLAARPITPDARQGVDPTVAEARTLRRQVVVASILGTPVVILAMGGHLSLWLHHRIAANIGQQASWLIQFTLTSLVLAFPGRVFLRTGLPLLASGRPDMNALVVLGALAAWAYSSLATFSPELLPAAAGAVYFEAAAVIVTLILLGRLLETRARGQAGDLLGLIAAAESRSEHPTARAVLQAAAGLALPPSRRFTVIPGAGIMALVGEKPVAAGTAALMAQQLASTSGLGTQAQALACQGKSPPFAAIDGQIAGLLAVSDRSKPRQKPPSTPCWRRGCCRSC